MNDHGTITRVKVDKFSVSFDPDLGDAVRDAARRAGGTVSGWLAEAAQVKLRSESLEAYLDDWEAEHGAPTPEQLRIASEELGLPIPPELLAE